MTQAFFDITDMPSDFGAMTDAEIVVNYGGFYFVGNDTQTLFAQIFEEDETTTMSDEETVVVVTDDVGFADTAPIIFSGLATSKSKTVWNSARLRLRWV